MALLGIRHEWEIVLMIAFVLIWDSVLNSLEYHVPFFRRILREREAALIQDGRVLRGDVRRELVTEDELLAVLRKKNVTDVSTVHSAYVEADATLRCPKGDNHDQSYSTRGASDSRSQACGADDVRCQGP